MTKKQGKDKATTPAFRQYTPRELLLKAEVESSALEKGRGKAVMRHELRLEFYRTWVEPLDLLLDSIAQNGFRSKPFHAARLGITPAMTGAIVQLFTGTTYRDFMQELLYLAVGRLEASNSQLSLQELSDVLGYNSYSSFYRLMKRQKGTSPTGRRLITEEEGRALLRRNRPDPG